VTELLVVLLHLVGECVDSRAKATKLGQHAERLLES
jgi:hypothetical protein